MPGKPETEEMDDLMGARARGLTGKAEGHERSQGLRERERAGGGGDGQDCKSHQQSKHHNRRPSAAPHRCSAQSDQSYSLAMSVTRDHLYPPCDPLSQAQCARTSKPFPPPFFDEHFHSSSVHTPPLPSPNFNSTTSCSASRRTITDCFVDPSFVFGFINLAWSSVISLAFPATDLASTRERAHTTSLTSPAATANVPRSCLRQRVKSPEKPLGPTASEHWKVARTASSTTSAHPHSCDFPSRVTSDPTNDSCRRV